MKIAIYGTGNVGSALGLGWARAGHQITYGSRDPAGAAAQRLVQAGGGAIRAVRSPEAAEGAQVVVLAVPWSAAEATIRSAGELAGKVVIDCTNPVKSDLAGLSIGFSNSAAEKVAHWALGGLVVKAFNTTHASAMANPSFGGTPADLFLCGDDPKARGIVASLGKDLGLVPVDVGPLRIARLLEPLAMLWIHLAFRHMWGTDFAFKVIRRGS